jgi:hypothetical protein
MKKNLVRGGRAADSRRSLVQHDAVRQVGGHDEVVLDDEGRLLRVQNEAEKAKRKRMNGLGEGTGMERGWEGKERRDGEGRGEERREEKRKESGEGRVREKC